MKSSRVCWICRESLKGLRHKILFVVSYPGLQQRESRVEVLEESLGLVALGRGLNEQDPYAESFPILQELSF